MPTDARLLTLAQWFSPSYPLGAFSYSHGLENAVAEGWIADADDVTAWLSGVLRNGTGRSDAIFFRLAACAERHELPQLEAEARAFSPAQERVQEAARMGAAFAQVTSDVWRIEVPPLLLPLALGRATQLAKLDQDMALALYLQSFVGNLVSVAQRLMPLGQTRAQQIVYHLQRECMVVVEDSRDTGLEDLWSTAFLSDIAAMRHETQETRVFQT